MGKRVALATAVLWLACSSDKSERGANADTQKEPTTRTNKSSLSDTPQASPPKKVDLVEWNLDESGFVLHGFDAVSYFTGTPVGGSDEFPLSWKGAKWKFSSQQNLDTFKQDPERYAPGLGGFCTFGIVIGKRLDGDPRVWIKIKDRIHIFLNKEVKAKFLQDEKNWQRAWSNWSVSLNGAID